MEDSGLLVFSEVDGGDSIRSRGSCEGYSRGVEEEVSSVLYERKRGDGWEVLGDTCLTKGMRAWVAQGSVS